MGWDFLIKQMHIRDFIDHEMKSMEAKTHRMGNDDLEVTQMNLKAPSNYDHEPIEVWFIADDVDDTQVLGVMLVDYYEDEVDSSTHPLIQCWGSKSILSYQAPSYHSCPTDYLDIVPVRSESEQRWREEVLRRAGR